MTFRVQGLDPALFAPLFALPDAELAARRARRVVADTKPGFPCRVSLEDAEPGETLLLVHFTHQPAETPFHASHAVYVREAAGETWDRIGEVPPALRERMLSLRAFDAEGMLVGGELVAGAGLEDAVARLFANPRAAYLQAHAAKLGCFLAKIDRA